MVAVVLVGLLILALAAPDLTARLLVENGAVEWVQVALVGGAGLLAARQARQARRAGQPAALEVAIVAAMVMVGIGEIDLDRMLFGTKVIATRFFVDPKHALALRALAVAVVVGGPLAVGLWLLRQRDHLWRAGVGGLREPWGQVAALGAGLFVTVEVLEGPLGRVAVFPPYFLEEVLELVAALGIFVGLAARHRAMMSTVSTRGLALLAAAALTLSACRADTPASAAQDRSRAAAPPPREVRVVPGAQRVLPPTQFASLITR
jgi:hypothetical protein